MPPSLESYKRTLSGYGTSIGEIHRNQAKMIMDATWERDTQSLLCYIYDFYHDSEPLKSTGMTYDDASPKTPIDAKYIITQYGTLSKDQVEYHIMFRPNQECPLPYYDSSYKEKYWAEFPVGLYVDVPDNTGTYRKWIICSKDYDPKFVKYSILPCNYYFRWINNGKKYGMWGVNRLRNSYNSGVWRDYIFQVPENQKQIWLPQNDVSDNLFYDQRIIVSAPRKNPICWSVSKLENDIPFGINKITLKQDKFNPKTDYVNLSTGEMYADYYKTIVEPEEPSEKPPVVNGYSTILFNGTSPVIKVGGSPKTLTAKFYDENDAESNNSIAQWSFSICGQNANDMILIDENGGNSVRVSALDDRLIGTSLEVSVINQDGLFPSELALEIQGL